VDFVRVDHKRRVYGGQYLSGFDARIAGLFYFRKKNYEFISTQTAYRVRGVRLEDSNVADNVVEGFVVFTAGVDLLGQFREDLDETSR